MKLKDYGDILLEHNSKKIKIKGYSIFLFNLLIIAFTYCSLTRIHFSMDSFLCIDGVQIDMHLLYGRVINAAIGIILNICHINPVQMQVFFTALYILIFAICSTLLTYVFIRLMENMTISKVILINLTVLISFANVFIVEWFYYPESLPFFIIFTTLIILSIVEFSRGFSLKHLLLSYLLLNIAANMYQITIVIFVIFTCTIVYIKNKGILTKKSIKELSVTVLMGLTTCIINILILKVVKALGFFADASKNTSIGLTTILNNAKALMLTQLRIWWNAFGLLPDCLVFIFGLVLIVSLIIVLIHKKESLKNIIFLLVVLFINYCMIYSPHLLLTVVWTTQRTMVGFFVFLSSLGLILLFHNRSETVSKILMCAAVIFLAVNIVHIQYINEDHFTNNKIDQEISAMVNQRIDNYERTSGISVKKVATHQDTNPTWSYQGVKYAAFETNIRGFLISWDDVGMINYYGHRNFQKITMPDSIYNQYFKCKDWTCFDPDEQMVFVGDTLYMIVY